MKREYPVYMVSVRFNDCSIEREEHDTLTDIYNSLLKLPRRMDAPVECFDLAEINIYTQDDDELAFSKKSGDLYANFLTELNYTIAEQMGVKL